MLEGFGLAKRSEFMGVRIRRMYTVVYAIHMKVCNSMCGERSYAMKHRNALHALTGSRSLSVVGHTPEFYCVFTRLMQYIGSPHDTITFVMFSV